MMTSQEESMYIKACVVANGIKDRQDDVITKKDIKKIFTNSIDVGFDVGHDNIRQSGIYSLENYISSQEETICDHVVPSGSWMTLLRVDNTEIQDMINKGEINGVSVTAYPEADAEIKRSNPQMLLYKDIANKGQLHPKEISLVETPANNLPLEVMDYETYISKSDKKESDNIIEKEDNTKDSTISKLVDILSSYTHISKDMPDFVEEEREVVNTGEVQEVEIKPEEDETVEKEEKEVKTDEEEESIQEPTEEKRSEESTEEDKPEKITLKKSDEALLKIAELCAMYLQEEEITKSYEEPIRTDTGSDEQTESLRKSEQEVTKKNTQKYDDSTLVEHTDITRLFAEQQGRDPWTFEKL